MSRPLTIQAIEPDFPQARPYGENGVAYLREHGVEVVSVDGPTDPRAVTPDTRPTKKTSDDNA